MMMLISYQLSYHPRARIKHKLTITAHMLGKVPKGERTLSVNLILTFDYNTWKYLTYSLVSTGNMTVYIKRILVYVYICKKEEMPYCRKWYRKERLHCRLAGPQAGLGWVGLVGDRPSDRPRPGSRPGGSGGWPAPKPALAGLQGG